MFCVEVTEAKRKKKNHTANTKINFYFYVLIKSLQRLTKLYTGCTEERMFLVSISESKFQYTRKMQILLYVCLPVSGNPQFFPHLKT